MIQIGGRRVAEFGVGDILEKFEKSEDPLYECHHDTYTKLQTFGAVVVGMVLGAGLYGLYARPMYKR